MKSMSIKHLGLRLLVRSLFLTLFLLLALLCLQLFCFQQKNYLGTSEAGLSGNLITSYPWTFGRELLKLLTYVGSWLWLACFAQLSIPQPPGKKNLFIKILFFHGLCFSYTLIALFSLLQYPALFENFLPSQTLKLSLFHLSQYVNPRLLLILGSGLFLTLVLYAAVINKLFFRIRKHTLALPCALIALSFLVKPIPFFIQTFPPDRYEKNSSKKIQDPTRKKHNLLLIAIDSLRNDRLNYKVMPEVFSLRNEDPKTVVFDDHIVGIPRTFPSWIEMLQGQYSARSGIRHMFPGFLPRQEKLSGLVHELEKMGYSPRTVISDFAGDIFPRFDVGFSSIQAPRMNIQTLIRMGVDQYFPFFLPFLCFEPGLSLFEENTLENPAFADPSTLTQKAMTELQNWRNQENPFFITLFYSTAHFPYAAPWPWYSKYSPPDYKGSFLFQKNPDLKEENRSLPLEDKLQIQALYDGSLRSIDQSLGELFAWLKKEKLWDSTLIVLTADHGEDLLEWDGIQGHGDHLRGEHVLKVPLIIKIPNTPENKLQIKTIPFTTRSIDLSPTILGLLGQDAPFEGKDLSPWLFDKARTPPELSAYSETEIWFSRSGKVFFQQERLDYPGISQLLRLDPADSGEIILKPQFEDIIVSAKHRSLTSGPYKLIYTPTAKGAFFKLYHRADDPYNLEDLANKNPTLFSSMKSELINLMLDLESPAQMIDDFLVRL